VEAVVTRALEAGSNAFQWIWDGLPPAERIIFSAIANQAREGTVLSENDITAVLQEAGIRILMKELNLAPQTLVNWQMLEQVEGGYRFFVELMRRWVAEYRPLDKVKDELDRINPLADTLYQAAQSFYQQENNEQAIAQLRQALTANPNHLKARLLLGTILREEGRLVEAVAEFEEVYRLDEREGRFELLRTLLQQGEALEAAGHQEDALATYNRVLAISPREQTAQARRAALWEKRGDQALAARDFAAALEAYRQAGADEKLAQVKAQQLKAELEQAAREAQVYERQEEWARAADVYRRLTHLDSDDERWRQALKRAEEELWLAERYAEGAGYVQQEEWVKAQKTLARVIGKRPDYRDAAELLALAKRRGAGQPDQTHGFRRRLYLVVGGGVTLLLLAVAGVWGYSQIQIQDQITRLAATATAQAVAAEIAAATQVAELRATQTAEVRITQTAQSRRTATAEAATRATRTAEARRTATAAVIATQTAQAPTSTPTPTLTPTSIGTPTSTPTVTPMPTLGIGSTRMRSIDGIVMVYVPEGEFLMGSIEGDPSAYSNEFPQHVVYLDAFWLDKTEVTNAQYAEFLNAVGGPKEEGGTLWIDVNHEWSPIRKLGSRYLPDEGTDTGPVSMVSWYGASAYCKWVGGRLPTEAEWEKGARGPDGRIYPWGNDFDGRKLNYCDKNCAFDWKDIEVSDGYPWGSPVGSYPDGTSPYGALDMAGNVYEWVADWHSDTYYAESPSGNPLGPTSGEKKVARGGSWFNEPREVRTAFRNVAEAPQNSNPNEGFRCVVPLERAENAK
jgi:formylglycine-generating enzyme required for sulfatase activity/tetratricopeptide (TPR) repeat protein